MPFRWSEAASDARMGGPGGAAGPPSSIAVWIFLAALEVEAAAEADDGGGFDGLAAGGAFAGAADRRFGRGRGRDGRRWSARRSQPTRAVRGRSRHLLRSASRRAERGLEVDESPLWRRWRLVVARRAGMVPPVLPSVRASQHPTGSSASASRHRSGTLSFRPATSASHL